MKFPWSGRERTGPESPVLHCSFCNKSQRYVQKLIAGPRVFICDQCVGICNDILAPDADFDHQISQAMEAHVASVATHDSEEPVETTPPPTSPVYCSLCMVSIPADQTIPVEARGLLCLACCRAVAAAYSPTHS